MDPPPKPGSSRNKCDGNDLSQPDSRKTAQDIIEEASRRIRDAKLELQKEEFRKDIARRNGYTSWEKYLEFREPTLHEKFELVDREGRAALALAHGFDSWEEYKHGTDDVQKRLF